MYLPLRLRKLPCWLVTTIHTHIENVASRSMDTLASTLTLLRNVNHVSCEVFTQSMYDKSKSIGFSHIIFLFRLKTTVQMLTSSNLLSIIHTLNKNVSISNINARIRIDSIPNFIVVPPLTSMGQTQQR